MKKLSDIKEMQPTLCFKKFIAEVVYKSLI